MQFVVIRLGKDSTADIKKLDADGASASIPLKFDFNCKQVEEGISKDDFVILAFGSNNNDGQPTSWKQGIRGIGKIIKLDRSGGFNDPCDFEIEILALFPESIDSYDFLERSASHFKYFSKYPVIGLKSSRPNAIQKVNDDERQSTSALLSAINILYPNLADQLQTTAPELLPFLNFIPIGEAATAVQAPSRLSDSDEVWSWVAHEVFTKHERNFLFLGAPGTGKTWYAHEIAKKLTRNESSRHVFVQFHPSFSYDDFVEGYTPKLHPGSSTIEYRLQEKHFLEICTKAKSDGSNIYVFVIDELTRGDPSRIFGELLTYLEVDHRNREFALAYSGTKTFVPENVVVIATANPYDRSVGELDDALIRRFVMRDFPPDVTLLEKQLKSNGTGDELISRLLNVFGLINDRMPSGFGHSHFWKIRTEEDFRTLWTSRIRFLLKRAFQFDETSLEGLMEDVERVFPNPAVGAPDEPDDEAAQAIENPEDAAPDGEA